MGNAGSVLSIVDRNDGGWSTRMAPTLLKRRSSQRLACSSLAESSAPPILKKQRSSTDGLSGQLAAASLQPERLTPTLPPKHGKDLRRQTSAPVDRRAKSSSPLA